ncbi:hypothetical protein Bca52824_024138 [Brassica carinata]|uniref:Uncharacterized protein n=1 Tax=Brassica carinata TaxID=52824 RepID=A0A8X7VJU3_BRACI|nr:hypothetical protein Bca52824_024138 [Brassica carinata]
MVRPFYSSSSSSDIRRHHRRELHYHIHRQNSRDGANGVCILQAFAIVSTRNQTRELCVVDNLSNNLNTVEKRRLMNVAKIHKSRSPEWSAAREMTSED